MLAGRTPSGTPQYAEIMALKPAAGDLAPSAPSKPQPINFRAIPSRPITFWVAIPRRLFLREHFRATIACWHSVASLFRYHRVP